VAKAQTQGAKILPKFGKSALDPKIVAKAKTKNIRNLPTSGKSPLDLN
jgi:hypothetical protein